MNNEATKMLFESFGLTDGDHTRTGWNDFDISSQLKLAQEKKVPPVYSTDYSFIRTYNAKTGFENTYEHNRAEEAKTAALTAIRSLQTTRPAIEHSSVVPSKDLHRTTIQQVARKVNHIHYDSVLFLTVINKTYRQVATNVLVEDEEGSCIMLSLYNYVAFHEDPDVIFPKGTHIALVAPYMKNSQDDRAKNLMLRCDNPQCVLIYDDDMNIDLWEISPTVSFENESDDLAILKEKGNKAFVEGNLTWARRFYSRVISSDSCDEKLKVACLSNRAEVSLREHRWEDAQTDAESVLGLEKDNVKAKFRLAKAMARLKMFPEALELANELLGGKSSNATKNLAEDIKRLALEQNGCFDYDSMRKEEARITRSPNKERTFHADFASTSVDFGVDINKGSYRGCQANTDLAEDELVSSSKAFAFTKIGLSTHHQISIERNIYSNTVNKQNDIELIGNVVRMLWKRPAVAEEFYKLSAGDESEVGHNRITHVTAINLPRIRGILNSNSFAQTDENESTLVKWTRIQKTKRLGRPLTEAEIEEDNAIKSADRGSGLWLRESLFNHSCAPNCTWVQVGDQMFIRTTRPVKKGEELCVSYTPLDKTFEEREEIFAGWISPGLGFSCACDCCDLLRSNGDMKRSAAEIEEAYIEAAKQVSFQGITMAKAAELSMPRSQRVQLIEKFEHVPLQNKSFTNKLHVMTGACMKAAGNHDGALKEFQKALEIGYAVRGGSSLEYFTDLWRVVGASMACKNRDLAYSSLSAIWNTRDFQGMPNSEAKTAFNDLTAHYAMPWWKDRQDYSCLARMEDLVKDVCNNKGISKKRKSGKKKGRK